MNEYTTPNFNVLIFEAEDIITASSPGLNIGTDDPDGSGWYG